MGWWLVRATPTIHVELPILWLLIGLSIVAAFASWANFRVRAYRLPAVGGGARLRRLLRAVRRGPSIIPALVRQTRRTAGGERLTSNATIALTPGRPTIFARSRRSRFPPNRTSPSRHSRPTRRPSDNIRLWDWQPLIDTYAQLQEIRTYYKFHDVDVDRYWLDGAYQRVMLSARELRSSLLPPNGPARRSLCSLPFMPQRSPASTLGW